jgi:myo-inositol-1(or 4)-monophosphatase
MEKKSKELEVAIKAALAGGKILEQYFETEILREIKEDDSIVTHVDKETEGLVKKILLDAFPEHSILGEETGLTKNGQEYTWYIDPIDGTRNFSNGIPLFAVSIALVYGGEVILGVVYNPTTDSLFYAEKGKGAYWNHQKMSVSKDDSNRCIITVTSGRKAPDLKLRRDLMHDLPLGTVSAVRDFGCSALDLSYIARGNMEAAIQLGLKPYDFAAGIILVQEAGGMVTTLDGGEWKFPDNYFIASNGVFPDLLIGEIKKQREKN